jgi:hypothetical protein
MAPTVRRKRKLYHRPLPYVSCLYCKGTCGPWLEAAIQPCHSCKRPLFRTRELSPIAPSAQVSGLLDTINAAQGLIGGAGIGAFVFGWISAHTLGLTIAMAMFVAGTALAVDGALGFQTRIVRLLDWLWTGKKARPVAVLKIAAAVTAFGLSFSGILTFSA